MKVYHVKKARKDYPEAGIKKGESYYWWKPRFWGVRRSKTYPSRQELTQSDFLCRVYDIEDEIAEGLEVDIEDDPSEIESEIENWLMNIISEIEELISECEDKLYNMPEQLQDTSEAGILLQDRIDALDNWINDLEDVDISIDEDLSEEELQDRVDEILEEIQSYGYMGE